MTLTITNGTLSSIKETIVPAAGYMRPSSVTVSGGTDSYTRGSGLLEISNPTDVTVAASALKSTAEIDVDELDLAPGTYQITVKAVGTGYADSDASNAVTLEVYDIEQEGDTLTIKTAPAVTQTGGALRIG